MKIKTTSEARDYLIEEVKREIVGPGNGHFTKDILSFQFNPKNLNKHKQEILDESPAVLYMAGILYPQKTLIENIEGDFEQEENDNAENENLDNDTGEKISKINNPNNIEESGSDDTKIDLDNNRDIDLTNDYKQSAIGLSALVKIPEKLKISINDMGVYHNLRKDIKNELLIICLFISKFAKDSQSYLWFKENYSLTNDRRTTTLNFLEKLFNIKQSRIKNIEDYYDKFFSLRKGWHQANKVNPLYDQIHQEHGSKNFDEFSLMVNNFISIVQENIDINKNLEKTELEDQKGYARESINSFLIFDKKELTEGKLIENFFLKENGEKLPLKASITVRKSKKSLDTKYLTIAIVNLNEYEKKYSLDKVFFQANFFVESLNGEPIFQNFEDISLEDLDSEERSLYLLHHLRENYSIGHGCSVNWSLDENNKCNKIYTEILPVTEVRPIKSKTLPNINLSMKKFSEDLEHAFEQLENLINQYEKWLSDEKKYGQNLKNSIFKEASSKNIIHCYNILSRIKEGFNILKTDKKIQQAFLFMNKAMYMQQVHYLIKPEDFTGDIDYEKFLKNTGRGNWRPFQICFILLNIKGIFDPYSTDREIVDLIWFPTGGGKTEAYLGLSSLVIFYRKINFPNANGTSILMRYTLRLLTTQQFQRASTLICACEKIRRDNITKLGGIKISIGLWVGGDVTPNDLKSAEYNLNELHESAEYEEDFVNNKFIILKCPWCNTKMSPNEYKVDSKKNFLFVCSNSKCDFSLDKKSLPIKVIDSEIYKELPTLLIGTIDKFATLPWREDAINAFDSCETNNFLPPDLIIQDEIHLISGPLGSIAGMYEIIISAITEKINNGKTIKAKIIGSTATISRANMQIKNLYGRDCHIFPPQANKLEDSFFAEEVLDKNILGRKYVGIFTPSSSSLEVTLSQLMAILNLAGGYLKQYSEENIDIYDPYWTNLIYFNSIRELMKGSSLIDGDANENIRSKWFRKGIMKSFIEDEAKYKNLRRKFDNDIEELTSRVDSSQIPKKLEILEKKANERGSLSACLATNMIQVGIDIGRLSLMTIVGQPKTTSEYIQASSRVGRELEKPGLVFTQLSHTKLRDRSHYEKFSSYHQNLYKYVEPTSVTSHSDPVRKRCLHAIVIFLVRFWSKNHRSSPLTPDNKLADRIKEYICNHVEKADAEHEEEVEKTKKEIDYIIRRWSSDTPEIYGFIGNNISKSKKSTLMKPSGSEQTLEGNPFETLTSMRNVDRECAALLRKSESR
jgi:hypothetical protein